MGRQHAFAGLAWRGKKKIGKCQPMVLERADAVAELRCIIGVTDPAQTDARAVRIPLRPGSAR